MLKNILLFVSGAALGAGVTYAIVNSKYDKLYQQDYLEMHAEKPVTVDEAAAAAKIYGRDSIILTEDPYKPVKTPSESVSDIPSVITPENENALRTHSKAPTEASSEPHIITEDEYRNEKRGYEKNELFYYAQDGVLCDEEDDPVPQQILDRIGPNAISDLESENNMYETYVRNDQFAADFCLTYVDRNWAESHTD